MLQEQQLGIVITYLYIQGTIKQHFEHKKPKKYFSSILQCMSKIDSSYLYKRGQFCWCILYLSNPGRVGSQKFMYFRINLLSDCFWKKCFDLKITLQASHDLKFQYIYFMNGVQISNSTSRGLEFLRAWKQALLLFWGPHLRNPSPWEVWNKICKPNLFSQMTLNTEVHKLAKPRFYRLDKKQNIFWLLIHPTSLLKLVFWSENFNQIGIYLLDININN